MWFITFRDDPREQGLLLTSSKDEVIDHGSPDMCSANQQSNGISHWGTLELYLVRIFCIFLRVPVYFITKETIVSIFGILNGI